MTAAAKLSLLLLISITYCVTGPILRAATYYIDFATGSDSNTGTSPTAAWKRAPGDAKATGVPAATALKPGDRVLFKGGTTYVGSIALKYSGASGSPITYDGSAWNGSKSTITTQNAANTSGFTDEGRSVSHLMIAGFDIKDIGGYAENDAIWSTTDPVSNPPGGSGISLHGGCSDITISNCNFAEICQWQNIIPMSGTTSVSGTGVSLQDNIRVTVANCDFTRMKTGVSIKALDVISDISVRDSSFHNYMNWLIDIAPRKAGATLRNVLIDGCQFYDYKEFDQPNWKGYDEKPHQDGIFLRTAGMASTWDNIVIRNSRFYSDQTSAGGTASIYLSQGSSADIYNCIFADDNHSNAYINVGYPKASGMLQRIRIWNNTFVGSTRAIKVTPGNSNADVVEIRNNAFYRTNTYDIISLNPKDIGTLVMDNNVYYNGNAARGFHDGSGYRSLSEWQTQTSKDRNSRWDNPSFESLSGNASVWKLKPASTSPLNGTGVDLSSFFATAIDGSARSTPWDIGAYSRASSSDLKLLPPNAPQDLRVSSAE